MAEVGVACVPTFKSSATDLWGQFDPYESYEDDDFSDDIDDEDEDDEEDEDENQDDFGFNYDSDGNPTFDDIQSYLMWRDAN